MTTVVPVAVPRVSPERSLRQRGWPALSSASPARAAKLSSAHDTPRRGCRCVRARGPLRLHQGAEELGGAGGRGLGSDGAALRGVGRRRTTAGRAAAGRRRRRGRGYAPELSGRSDGLLFAKGGLWLRDNPAVRLAVVGPEAALVGWGKPGRPARELAVSACSGNGWKVWPGGFYVPEPTCVRLQVETQQGPVKAAVPVGATCE